MRSGHALSAGEERHAHNSPGCLTDGNLSPLRRDIPRFLRPTSGPRQQMMHEADAGPNRRRSAGAHRRDQPPKEKPPASSTKVTSSAGGTSMTMDAP